MGVFRRAPRVVPPPDWRLSITPGLMQHDEKIIDGVRVTFDKPCWTWNIIREDLRAYGASWMRDMGVADTKEEALEIGLKKMKQAQKTNPGQ